MIEISAFGGFQVTTDGQVVTLTNRKSQALLIYLASNHDQLHERLVLAELFWPTLPEQAALNNLSKALGQVRAIVNQNDEGPTVVELTRHAAKMIASTAWQLDANLFVQLIEQAQASPKRHDSVALLEKATSLYAGEFLAGLSLEDCPTFDGWLLLRRESLMLMARDSYQKVAAFYLDERAFEKAERHARKQLALDAWHEEAHRQLMQALAGQGRRNDALAQYEACREILRSELGVETERATQALYEQIKSGQMEASIEGRSTTRPRPPVQLPRQLLPLLGREKELSRLKRDLQDPACRMVTIAGAGGVGKTSLALEAAWVVARHFSDGAYFVPLERLQPSPEADLDELLAASIGVALGLSFSGMEPVHQQLYRHLGNKEILLLLDNFEHLMTPLGHSGPALLTTLMERAPGVKMLITSRERFGITAEYVLPLEGLPIPPSGVALAHMTDFSSIRLFVEQARRIERGFRLTGDNGSAVADICRLVNGIPLGIELAARWVTHFTCAEIAAAIREDLGFLAAESPQVTQRHQSIRATFSYSWRMLTGDEQQMLRQLALVLGRFSREAALNITQGSLGTLVRLQGKSLLRQEGPGHYSLHELLRQFAAERLDDEPAERLEALSRRYCSYFLNRLVEQGEGFNQRWTGEAIKEIALSIDNIRNAWQLAMELGYFDLLDRALQALYHYYRIQGLFREAQQIFGHATATFRSLHQQESDNKLAETLLGRALVRQGRLAWFLADTQQATLLMEEGLQHLLNTGAQADLPRAYAYLGEGALRLGCLAEAQPLLDKALELFRQADDSHGVAFTLELKAVITSQGEQFEETDRLFRESMAINQRQGNRRLEGRAMHDWGMILLRQGRLRQAAELFRDSLAIARELDLRMPIAFNQSMLARIDRHAGNYERARQRLLASLEVLEGSGYAAYIIKALNLLGEVMALTGHSGEARLALERSLAQLCEMQPTTLATFRSVVLDFLVAAAYFFAGSDRDQPGIHYLRLVTQNVGRETDVGMRAEQLAARLSVAEPSQQEDWPVHSLSDEASLSQIISEFRF